MRRLLFAVTLVGIAGLAYRFFVWSAQTRGVWPVSGRATSPIVADDRWIGWLEKDATTSRLVVGAPRGGERREVLSANSLSGLAIEGDRAFVARAEDGTGKGRIALVGVTLPDGGANVVGELGGVADEIVASEGWVVWGSTRRSGLGGIPFLVAGEPLRVIQACRAEGGDIRTLAVISGGGGVSSGTKGLLGVTDGNAYWTQWDESSAPFRTRVVRTPCEGGDVEVVVVEDGSRMAALEDDVLVWTAPSLEAGGVDTFASVKRMRVEETQPEVIGDWFEPNVVVLLSKGTAYAYDSSGLWRLGSGREEQRHLLAGRVRGMVIGKGDDGYLMAGARGSAVVAKRPLTWWARFKATVTP